MNQVGMNQVGMNQVGVKPAGGGAPHWRALSEGTQRGPDWLLRGLLVAEFTLPLERSFRLRAGTGATGLHLMADPAAGICLTQHREGQEVALALPGPLPAGRATARISFAFDSSTGHGSLTLEGGDAARFKRSQTGRGCLPLHLPSLLAAPRDPALLWFGASEAQDLPEDMPWLGLSARVETPRGPVLAGALRPGDLVCTLESGPLPIAQLNRRQRPARGSFAPILLRQPFFGLTGDILVSADQPILISGSWVEYLCGEEEVLVPARALCDGRLAEWEHRRALVEGVSLDLGQTALLLVDGCCLASRAASGQTLPRRELADWELPALHALLGKVALRHIA